MRGDLSEPVAWSATENTIDTAWSSSWKMTRTTTTPTESAECCAATACRSTEFEPVLGLRGRTLPANLNFHELTATQLGCVRFGADVCFAGICDRARQCFGLWSLSSQTDHDRVQAIAGDQGGHSGVCLQPGGISLV